MAVVQTLRPIASFIAKKATRWWGLKFLLDEVWVSNADVPESLLPLVDDYKGLEGSIFRVLRANLGTPTTWAL